MLVSKSLSWSIWDSNGGPHSKQKSLFALRVESFYGVGLGADMLAVYGYGSTGVTGTDPATSVPTSAPYGNSTWSYDPSGTAPYPTGTDPTYTGTVGTVGDPSGTAASTGLDPSGKPTYTAPTGVPAEYFYHHKKPKRNVRRSSSFPKAASDEECADRSGTVSLLRPWLWLPGLKTYLSDPQRCCFRLTRHGKECWWICQQRPHGKEGWMVVVDMDGHTGIIALRFLSLSLTHSLSPLFVMSFSSSHSMHDHSTFAFSLCHGRCHSLIRPLVAHTCTAVIVPFDSFPPRANHLFHYLDLD